MKIKIIDILNTIARGETPPKKIYYLEEVFTYDENGKEYYDSDTYGLFDYHEITDILNDEVEILETTLNIENMNINSRSIPFNGDQKIEKISLETIGMHYIKNNQLEEFIKQLNKNKNRINDKINEIIDKLNGE